MSLSLKLVEHTSKSDFELFKNAYGRECDLNFELALPKSF